MRNALFSEEFHWMQKMTLEASDENASTKWQHCSTPSRRSLPTIWRGSELMICLANLHKRVTFDTTTTKLSPVKPIHWRTRPVEDCRLGVNKSMDYCGKHILEETSPTGIQSLNLLEGRKLGKYKMEKSTFRERNSKGLCYTQWEHNLSRCTKSSFETYRQLNRCALLKNFLLWKISVSAGNLFLSSKTAIYFQIAYELVKNHQRWMKSGKIVSVIIFIGISSFSV